MKTPEEIKKGLECCDFEYWQGRKCEQCPYMNADDVRCNSMDEIRGDVIAYIQHLEAQVPKWISVEERLPEDVEYVLCWYKDEFGGEWSTVGMKVQWGCGWDLDIDDGSGRNLTVTHWMPMPEPPKEYRSTEC